MSDAELYCERWPDFGSGRDVVLLDQSFFGKMKEIVAFHSRKMRRNAGPFQELDVEIEHLRYDQPCKG